MRGTMNFDDATESAGQALRRRPVEILAVFVSGTAVPMAIQSTVIATLGAVLLVRGIGPIDRVVSTFRDVDVPLSEAESRALTEAFDVLMTPGVVAVLVVAAVVALVLAVLVRSAVGAAKVSAARAAMTGEAPTVAAFGGIRPHVWTFVGLTLLQAVLALVALWVFPLLLVLVHFGLLFVPQAIVVDDVGLTDALGNNFAFLRSEFDRAIGYVALEFGLIVLGTIVNVGLSFVGTPRLGGLVLLLAFLPFLGLVKVGVYLDAGGSEEPKDAGDVRPMVRGEAGGRSDADGPSAGRSGVEDRSSDPERDGDADGPRWARPPDSAPVGPGAEGRSERSPADDRSPEFPTGTGVEGESLVEDVLGVFRAGVDELRRFLRERRGLVGIAFALFLLGIGAGHQLAVAVDVELIPPSEVGADFGVIPIDTAVNLFANNWSVAIAQSYAGFAFGFPVVVNVIFNGGIVGFIGGMVEPAVFAAYIVPHGILEAPALAVSGALGMHLAGRGWAFSRGRLSAEEMGDQLRRGFLVLVGLAPVFALAGLIEAFVTPLIGSAVAAAAV